MSSFFDFRPLSPFTNPHVQTVLGNVFGKGPAVPAVRHLVPLGDGDRLVLHDTTPPGWRPGRPAVLLVHGLGGCHRSGYMQRMTGRLVRCGVRVFRMDMRGAGAGFRLARKLYCAAASADVRAALDAVAALAPGSPLGLAGFSLGGNIVLKCAGEAGAQPIPALRAVAAVAPPIDLVACSDLMARLPWYDAYYVRHLLAQVVRHQRHFPHLPRVRFPRGLTLRQFDDLYTAPRWGFADALDYYRRASAFPLIGRIDVPTLILTARDDPFVAAEPFDRLPPNPAVTVHVARHGGHLGFVGPDGQGGLRWAETQVLDWLLRGLRA